MDRNAGESREGASRREAQDLARQPRHQVFAQATHEHGKGTLRHLIVKRLVLHGGITQRIEGAMSIGDALHTQGGEHFNQAKRQSIGRDLSYLMAKPYGLAQGIQHPLAESLFESMGHRANVSTSIRCLLIRYWINDQIGGALQVSFTYQ